eukprot:6946566-Prorocentrum_lima.AAC.1
MTLQHLILYVPGGTTVSPRMQHLQWDLVAETLHGIGGALDHILCKNLGLKMNHAQVDVFMPS